MGGGLANGLLALRLKSARPELRVLVVERGDRLGGNHTWSFHRGDLTYAQEAWAAPLIEHHWDAQTVRFPKYERTLAVGYRSITSTHFHDVLSPRLGEGLLLGRGVREVLPTSVTLDDGEVLEARCVVDGRGFGPAITVPSGYQKFVGLDVKLERPHGLSAPMIMDASVPQLEGYRFVYCLPWSADSLLIEDTRYSDEPELDVPAMRREIEAYASRQGWKIAHVEREEAAALPIPLSGTLDEYAPDLARSPVPVSGVRAGLFHPTTGYSVPYAARFADALAAQRDLSAAAVLAFCRAWSRREWDGGAYYRVLNRLLFQGAHPEQRYRIFEHFYRFGEPLIGRFYAGESRALDKVAILAWGKPPMPIGRAVGVFARMAQEGRR